MNWFSFRTVKPIDGTMVLVLLASFDLEDSMCEPDFYADVFLARSEEGGMSLCLSERLQPYLDSDTYMTHWAPIPDMPKEPFSGGLSLATGTFKEVVKR